MFSATLLVALIIDAVIGWPAQLFRAIGHPAVWLGKLVAILDHRLNNQAASPRWRRACGIVTLILVVIVATIPFLLLQTALAIYAPPIISVVVLAIFAWPLIAARSLYDHVAAVLAPLRQGDLDGARAAVAMIVGRDVTQLDEAGVARAAIESLAENSSDGVIAPLFWGALLGLPGIAAYKAINTLDSMIGHRTKRHADFGWASARLDDLVNLIPARLTGLLIALASGHPKLALEVMVRDARKHRSPNAGFPEAAMAGALGVRLSGPRSYAGGTSNEPWLNSGAPDPTAEGLAQALRIYGRTVAIKAALLLAITVLIMLSGHMA